MDTITENAFDVFMELLKGKHGISKGDFIPLMEGLLAHEEAVVRLFEHGNVYGVYDDENEFSVENAFLMEKGGNGYYYNRLRKDRIQNMKWVRMYRRPHDLTILDAFSLAHTFKDDSGRITLPEEDARLYRHVPVGETPRNAPVMTFVEFCEKINEFLTKEDTA